MVGFTEMQRHWDLEDLSRRLGFDYIYERPKIVECFIQRCAQELPHGWTARPQTILRQVGIFDRMDVRQFIVSYEAIESNIVWCLDDAVARAKGVTRA